ncbi:hypothetical protein I317_02170 [Kwoniella heveanensis CBS 569]|nr:hypothetical protein I317_02170 [Kwoniella heveanensis CBS 569]
MSSELQEPTEEQIQLLRTPSTTLSDLDKAFPYVKRELDPDDDIYGRHRVQLHKAYSAEGSRPEVKSRAIQLMTERALASETFTSLKPMVLNQAVK